MHSLGRRRRLTAQNEKVSQKKNIMKSKARKDKLEA